MEYFINRSVNAMPSSSIACMRKTKPGQASLLSFDFLFSHTKDESEHYLFVFMGIRWIFPCFLHKRQFLISTAQFLHANKEQDVPDVASWALTQGIHFGPWHHLCHTTLKSFEDQTESEKQLHSIVHRIIKMQDKQALDILPEGLASWRELSSPMACFKPFSTSKDRLCDSDSQEHHVTVRVHNPSTQTASTTIYSAPGLRGQ